MFIAGVNDDVGADGICPLAQQPSLSKVITSL
jgi:hypothetical protein